MTEGTTMAETTPAQWRRIAQADARFSGEDEFHIRCGVRPISEPECISVFNNHPYAADKNLRDEELAILRKSLAAEGFREVAFATYPESGTDKGYTYSLVIDAPHDAVDRVMELYQAARMLSFHKLRAPAA